MTCYKPNIFVCAKVFIFYNAVKPCEICATKAKYFQNQCITPGKMLCKFDPTILKCKGQIRERASGIVVLNN